MATIMSLLILAFLDQLFSCMPYYTYTCPMPRSLVLHAGIPQTEYSASTSAAFGDPICKSARRARVSFTSEGGNSRQMVAGQLSQVQGQSSISKRGDGKRAAYPQGGNSHDDRQSRAPLQRRAPGALIVGNLALAPWHLDRLTQMGKRGPAHTIKKISLLTRSIASYIVNALI